MFNVKVFDTNFELWINNYFVLTWGYDDYVTKEVIEEMKKRLEKDISIDINRDRDTQLFTMRLLKEFTNEKA